jgi:hypothetical protein
VLTDVKLRLFSHLMSGGGLDLASGAAAASQARALHIGCVSGGALTTRLLTVHRLAKAQMGAITAGQRDVVID